MHGFRALYHNPHTRIRLPGCSSDYLSLGRGTRQGCPLSSLIFALAIEPLARAIKASPNIRGYWKGAEEFRLSLYADDMLMFLPDPLVSLSNLVEILGEFHTYSGLGVNMKKCSALLINMSNVLRDTIRDSFPI